MSRYFNDFSDTYGVSLEHHGILGMKWGGFVGIRIKMDR